MSVDTIVALLARIPIFSRLRPGQITEIVRRAEKIKFRSRECITEAGASGNGAYLLVSGNAEDLADPNLSLPPGSLIGELAMIVEHQYGATVVARNRVHCLKITRAAMRSQMLADPSLAEHLSRHIKERLLNVADGLMHIDQLLAQSDVVPSGQPAFVLPHHGPSSLDRILSTQ